MTIIIFLTSMLIGCNNVDSTRNSFVPIGPTAPTEIPETDEDASDLDCE